MIELKPLLKVGQKWQDSEGTIRNIKNVTDSRVTYSFTIANDAKEYRMGSGSPEDFRDDILIADEGSVTFTREEARLLKRLLAGYQVGKVGQSILDKLKSVK